MNLLIKNRKSFVQNFLTPISKISNTCIVSITNKGFSSLLTTPDGTIILYSFFNYENTFEPVKLHLPDLSRLIRILQCIETDDIELKLDTNNLKYNSKNLRFTYHLLHEGIIPQCKISVDKIKAIDYQTTFSISADTLVNIVRSNTFVSDTSKIYFSSTSEDKTIYGELTDKTRQNVDSVKIILANDYKGEGIPNDIPLNYEVLRIITTSRCNNVNVLINNPKSVITFDVTNENVKNLYIASGLKD